MRSMFGVLFVRLKYFHRLLLLRKELSSSSVPSPASCPTYSEVISNPCSFSSPPFSLVSDTVYGTDTFVGAYNSSKAAIDSIADTLRIELYPFNVKVLNICTGGVKTNLSPNSITRWDLKLPPSSIYMPIEQYFKKRQGYSNANAISASEYAKHVVRAVEGAIGSGWIWEGYFSFGAWFLSTFAWRTIFDIFMRRAFGLEELKRLVQERKKRV